MYAHAVNAFIAIIFKGTYIQMKKEVEKNTEFQAQRPRGQDGYRLTRRLIWEEIDTWRRSYPISLFPFVFIITACYFAIFSFRERKKKKDDNRVDNKEII